MGVTKKAVTKPMSKLDFMKKVGGLVFKHDDIMMQEDLFLLQNIVFAEFEAEEKAGNITLKKNSKGQSLLPR